MVRDKRTAEELLQETFWRVWRHADTYVPGRARFATWILRIAHNLTVTEQRHEARRPRIVTCCPDAAPETGCDPPCLPHVGRCLIPDLPATEPE
jgi:RNA polymerase sigma-70 factor (ECF subfamily)